MPNPESFISFLFLKSVSYLHYIVTSESAENKMINNQDNYLFKYHLTLKESLNNTTEVNTALSEYQSNTWVWNGVQHPHETFAVYFVRKNLWLSFYMQIMFFAMISVFAIMSLLLVYMNCVNKGGF